MTAPCLLALDSATDQLALGLRTPAGRWRRELPGAAAASAQLLPAVAALAAEAGIALGALQAVAFGAGPGAFTGLRTACAAAQGLALGLGCPLLPLDNLALLAEDAAATDPALADGRLLWVAVDARMDEVYAAAYRAAPQAGGPAGQAPGLSSGLPPGLPPGPVAEPLSALPSALPSDPPSAPPSDPARLTRATAPDPFADAAGPADRAGLADPADAPTRPPFSGRWQLLRAPALYTLPALARAWADEAPDTVVGNATEVFADRLPWGSARRLATVSDRAGALLRLAEQAHAAGWQVPAAQALPLYLRDKVALTTAERARPQPATGAGVAGASAALTAKPAKAAKAAPGGAR